MSVYSVNLSYILRKNITELIETHLRLSSNYGYRGVLDHFDRMCLSVVIDIISDYTNIEEESSIMHEYVENFRNFDLAGDLSYVYQVLLPDELPGILVRKMEDYFGIR